MSSIDYEDIIMKHVHDYFGKALLPFLGIHEQIAEAGKTELPLLTMTRMYMDFTFLTTSGKYLHFEFQTTDGGLRDLQRFHAYEAWLRYSTGKEVITYVIFTGGIHKPVYEDPYGINTYCTIPISMADKDADALLSHLKEKKARKEALTQEDLAQLALTPVMGSRKTKTECIFEAMELVHDEPGEDAQKVMAVLYAFAEKFMGRTDDLKKLREVMLMTRLGQMLFDEGLEQGREQGRQQGLAQGREQGLAQGREQGLAQGYDLMNRLIEKLLADGRLEDLRRSASDSAYQKQLIDEYHLDTRARV